MQGPDRLGDLVPRSFLLCTLHTANPPPFIEGNILQSTEVCSKGIPCVLYIMLAVHHPYIRTCFVETRI